MLITSFSRFSFRSGFLATAGVLTAGLVNFKRGGPASVSHRMMRLRVLMQAATMGAFVIGGGSFIQGNLEKEEGPSRDNERETGP